MILPFVREILADAEKSAAFQRAASQIQLREGGLPSPARRIRVSGLTATAKALHLPLLQRVAGKPLLVIVARNRDAEELLPVVQAFADLTGSLKPQSIIKFPAHDVLPFEDASPHPEIQEERATALWKIATGAVSLVIASLEATVMRLRPAEFYAGLARIVRRSESLDVEELIEHLRVTGYASADMVEMPGQLALRGGILDVYPPESDRPLRIELFGDEVESIRKFDPASQRSSALNAPLDELVLLPFSETPVSVETLSAIHTRLLHDEGLRHTVPGDVAPIFPGWEFFAPLAQSQIGAGGRGGQSLFDLISRVNVVLDEPSRLSTEHQRWWEKVNERHERSGLGERVTPEDIYFSPDEWQQRLRDLAGLKIEMEQLQVFRAGEADGGPDDDSAGNVTPHDDLGVNAMVAERDSVDARADGRDLPESPAISLPNFTSNSAFNSQPAMRFHGSVAAIVEEVQKLNRQGRRVMLVAPNTGELERLAGIFAEYQLPFRVGSRNPVAGSQADLFVEESTYYGGDFTATTLVKADVPDGVVLPEANLVLFGARDLFDESEAVVSRPLRQKSKTSAFLSDFRDLAVGDYVVHVEHGVARYQGLKEIVHGDSAGEFMVLEFAEAAKLYVPLTRLDLVQKYRTTEGGHPQLSRLGSAAWAKTKASVKKAMVDMAAELLKLYAERKSSPGHAFAADTEWQREFEDAFEHNETDDQLTSLADIKRDMESTLPMDRLLCGDVGFGKTEVAMRAAFKAVSDGKQVAVLAPTTVLAFQHQQTFKNRLAAFPITVEMVSRFRTARQVKEILERLESGQVDIIIGTHRLLSKDVKFHDLGLVVVDEEQRFGVRHKERLKQLRKEVDVLTLSATPIPRTLHMGLAGLRDMSVIETPPSDRIAIQTVVAGFDEKLIRMAIEHELDRGGQAYFVHNRVESIYEIAARIQELVPRARVIVGHGQMSEGELEKVMLAFVRHEADVLVATTIIENGLDIALCNTIMINRADRHGLSELYQLRGRVGRSNRRAYAYLLIPPEVEITPIARQRLAALKEFSELGAGFKIAALDLELRGAGNLLGGEQSGHIQDVGFEMYTSMLEQSVRELKGEETVARIHTSLNLGLNLRIPPEYIAEENQRLRMYKRIAGVSDEARLNDVRNELKDRYGEIPDTVSNLLHAGSLKLLCEQLGVASIDRKRDVISVKFSEDARIDPEKLAVFVGGQRGAQFSPGGILKFSLPGRQFETTHAEEIMTYIHKVLADMAAEPVAVV